MRTAFSRKAHLPLLNVSGLDQVSSKSNMTRSFSETLSRASMAQNSIHWRNLLTSHSHIIQRPASHGNVRAPKGLLWAWLEASYIRPWLRLHSHLQSEMTSWLVPPLFVRALRRLEWHSRSITHSSTSAHERVESMLQKLSYSQLTLRLMILTGRSFSRLRKRTMSCLIRRDK